MRFRVARQRIYKNMNMWLLAIASLLLDTYRNTWLQESRRDGMFRMFAVDKKE